MPPRKLAPITGYVFCARGDADKGCSSDTPPARQCMHGGSDAMINRKIEKKRSLCSGRGRGTATARFHATPCEARRRRSCDHFRSGGAAGTVPGKTQDCVNCRMNRRMLMSARVVLALAAVCLRGILRDQQIVRHRDDGQQDQDEHGQRHDLRAPVRPGLGREAHP